jgi:hypothetical protein
VEEDSGRFLSVALQRESPVSTSEAINEQLIEAAELTNAYELAQILREDARFIDLGRFLFALEEWDIEERAHVYDLVPKARAGRPPCDSWGTVERASTFPFDVCNFYAEPTTQAQRCATTALGITDCVCGATRQRNFSSPKRTS